MLIWYTFQAVARSGTIGWDERRVIATEWWEYASSVNVVWDMFLFIFLCFVKWDKFSHGLS